MRNKMGELVPMDVLRVHLLTSLMLTVHVELLVWCLACVICCV